MANIFIYGGCVSRDTFELMKEEHSLVHYVSRQSLISATSPPTPKRVISTTHLVDNFQNRSVVGDLNSSLIPTISNKSNKIELFLFDILSERLGAFRLPGGSYITRSTELLKTGLLTTLEKPAASIPFASERHFELWSIAAEKLASTLKSLDLFDRSMFIEAPWTDVSTDGGAVPKFRGWTAEQANADYKRYYTHLRELGFASRTIPKRLAISTSTHKWGPAPYHYVDACYLWLREEITALDQSPSEKLIPSVPSSQGLNVD